MASLATATSGNDGTMTLLTRKRTRLEGFDYSTPGCYFTTINTRTRGFWFGSVIDGVVFSNDAGRMIQNAWKSLPERFAGTTVDAAVVMPDHIHGIAILGCDPEAATRPTLSDVVGAFKSITTVEYGRGVDSAGRPPYEKRLWHRSFRDTIIRSDKALARFQEYIEANPARWSEKHER